MEGVAYYLARARAEPVPPLAPPAETPRADHFQAIEANKRQVRLAVIKSRESDLAHYYETGGERPADSKLAEWGLPLRGTSEYERIVAVVDCFEASTKYSKERMIEAVERKRKRGDVFGIVVEGEEKCI